MIQTLIPTSRLRFPRRARPATTPTPAQPEPVPATSSVLLTVDAWAAQQGLGTSSARSYVRQRRVAGMVTGITPSGVVRLIPSGAGLLPPNTQAPERRLNLTPLNRWAAERDLNLNAALWLGKEGWLRVYHIGPRAYVASGAEVPERQCERARWLGEPQTLYAWVVRLSRLGRSAAQVRDIMGDAYVTLKTVHEYRSRARSRGEL